MVTEARVVGESRLLIGGRLVEAQSGARFLNTNPATEEVIGEVADAAAADMGEAIAAAREAFDTTSWSRDPGFRSRCLRQLASALDAEKEVLREVLIAEAGVPRSHTHAHQLDFPVRDALLHPAQLIDTFAWDEDRGTAEAFGRESRRSVWREPIGVVGAIVPWNAPVDITLNKIGPILATGNTAVLKPASDTPWNATILGRIVAEMTDIPPGVLNIVTTSDNGVAEQLVVSPSVDMISFTGSTATGARILASGAPTIKRTFLELGGKSATIVLDDADFGVVVPGGIAVCWHSGQGCALPTRMLLPRSRYAEGLEILVEAMRAVKYGDPDSASVFMGPVINERQRDRILGYIESGTREGARLVLGGRRPVDLPRGYYIEPTVFADVDSSMTIAQEEIFGPVLSVIPYDDDDDAVRIANDSVYGLSAAVFSASDERALAVGRCIRTGTLSINGGSWAAVDMPYGGWKRSGIGSQNGIEGFEQYLHVRAVGWSS